MKTVEHSDVDVSFGRHPNTGDVIRKRGNAAVLQSVRNLLQSVFYERPFHPEIGSQIKSALFENITPTSVKMLEFFIKQTFENFEPRVALVDLVVSDDGANGLDIALQLEILTTQETVTFSFILERLR